VDQQHCSAKERGPGDFSGRGTATLEFGERLVSGASKQLSINTLSQTGD